MSYKLRLNKATLEVQQQARKVSIPNQDVKQKKRKKEEEKNKQTKQHPQIRHSLCQTHGGNACKYTANLEAWQKPMR